MKSLFAAVMTAIVLASPAALAQEQAADNTQVLLEKVRADKKLLVATNMGMTESEAAAFWPVYDAYQKELNALNGRTRSLIETYAAAYVVEQHRPGRHTADGHRARQRVEEPHEDCCERRLPGAGRTDDADPRSGAEVELEVPEGGVGVPARRHVSQYDGRGR